MLNYFAAYCQQPPGLKYLFVSIYFLMLFL